MTTRTNTNGEAGGKRLETGSRDRRAERSGATGSGVTGPRGVSTSQPEQVAHNVGRGGVKVADIHGEGRSPSPLPDDISGLADMLRGGWTVTLERRGLSQFLGMAYCLDPERAREVYFSILLRGREPSSLSYKELAAIESDAEKLAQDYFVVTAYAATPERVLERLTSLANPDNAAGTAPEGKGASGE